MDRSGGADESGQGAARFHGLVLVVIVVAVAVLYLTTSLVREVIFAGLAAATIPAIAVGIRVHRVAYRLPWRLAIVAMSCLTPLVATWTTVASVSGNADSVTAHPVAAVTARYVRLSVAAGTQTGEPVSRIYEIEVYGT